jgi:hypothetical protein
LNLQPSDILFGVAIGAGATLAMDLWNLLLKRFFGIPSLNYCLLGRWLLHIPLGTFKHASIASATPRPRECTIGWIGHYSIGIGLALAFVIFGPAGWVARPTLLPALLYGIVTVVFPLFVLQPSLGLGIASSKAPHPMRARLKSLMTHTVFGLALVACAWGVRSILGLPS